MKQTWFCIYHTCRFCITDFVSRGIPVLEGSSNLTSAGVSASGSNAKEQDDEIEHFRTELQSILAIATQLQQQQQ